MHNVHMYVSSRLGSFAICEYLLICKINTSCILWHCINCVVFKKEFKYFLFTDILNGTQYILYSKRVPYLQ